MLITAAYIITYISSFCMLVIEIVAGRILAPFVGVSLYTWTSIIGVVLAGISIGAYLGGLIADRYPHPSTLGWLLFISGLGAFSISPLTNPLIFALTATMLVPYIIIGVMGGGQTLQAISGGKVPYCAGGAIVALVVMSYVFFGGMRGTAWVNTFQTLMFLCFGTIAFVLIGKNLGGFDQVMQRLTANEATAPLLTRQRIPVQEFFSYAFFPLFFHHVPARGHHVDDREEGLVLQEDRGLLSDLHPAALVAGVFLGVVAADSFPGLKPGESDGVILRLLTANTDVLLAGVLGAAIMAWP